MARATTRCAWSATTAPAVTGLRGAWIDAGDRDEYYLDLGARALRASDRSRRAFPRSGSTSSSFPGGHRGVSHRYPLSLAYLIGSLSITF